MKFKVGDKVKVISLDNSFVNYFNKAVFGYFLNKTFTVYNATNSYVTVEENAFTWSNEDLILINNGLEIE